MGCDVTMCVSLKRNGWHTIFMFYYLYYQYQGFMSRFSRNSKPNAYELLENIEDFFPRYNMQVLLYVVLSVVIGLNCEEKVINTYLKVYFLDFNPFATGKTPLCGRAC